VFAFAMSIVVGLSFFLTASARGVVLGPYPSNFWLGVVGLVAFVSIGGHAVFTHLLNEIDVNALSCAKLLEPALAAAGAALFLKEGLSPRTLCAFALVTSAVLLILLPGRTAARLPPAEVEDD
jgi:drug/metabolite transporter (DMT)-like permease